MKKFLATAAILLGLPGNALTITSVSSPNLTLPKDDTLYSFVMVSSGTFTSDFDPPELDVWYYDEDIFVDDPIDKSGKMSLGPVIKGGNWGPINTIFQVGCRANGNVFGPASGTSSTGENPMDDGYFWFRTGELFSYTNYGLWGYNTVTCDSGANPPPTPPNPTNPPQNDWKPVPGPLPILLPIISWKWIKKFRSTTRSNVIS
jgi:hypothetical protein